MKTDSLKRLAILGLSSEQMSVVLDVLAVELAPMERTRELAAQRQQRYTERHTNVRVTLPAQRQDDVISDASRVIDNLPSCLTSGKIVESKIPPLTPPFSKPLEPPGFADFFAIYPMRAGGADRKTAAKAFGAALKRSRFQDILNGANAYAGYCEATGKSGTEFVLKARKWLNDDGWKNTYETVRTNHKPNSIASGFDLIDRAIEERFGSSETDTTDIPRLLKIAS